VMAKSRTAIFTVSQVNTLIKGALENSLPSRLSVRGEISDWKLHRQSGHCYFTLKDKDSVLPSVMWRSNFAKTKFQPENGMEILATGNIDVYPPQGKYQFYVDRMDPAGVGALQLAFEQLVAKLSAEGLFDDKHKKPLPGYPMRIGILTSESGAAVHDIADSIFNRFGCARLFLYPVPVQGEGSAEKIAAAIRDINKRNDKLCLDILIVGRGGGSMEDLWEFNKEVLARAIFASEIPIISAVGHEVDTTIADLVADALASTPTKAGVVAVPDRVELLEQLASLENRMVRRIEASIELAGERLNSILASALFRQPMVMVRNREQWLDSSQSNLAGALRELVIRAERRLALAEQKVLRIEPHRLLGKMAVDLGSLNSRADAAIHAVFNNARMELTAKANLLTGLNPKTVLKRGYSITTDKRTGKVVRKIDDIELGDTLVTELAGENLVESKVVKK